MDISLILITKYPGTEWALTGKTYAGLEWLDDSPKPTEAELEALWPEVEAEGENAAEAKDKAKKTALGKLKKLGLTDDEIEALLT